MADAKDQHEPSMEEILASIRRIIAEDGETTEGDKGDAKVAGAPAKAEEDDVLELTEVVEEDEPVANTSEAPVADKDEAPFTLEARPEPARADPPAAAADERLVSAESASASVAALAQLVNRPRERSDEMSMGNADRTLEDVVRELLRPMLKTWLDDHLPQMVERLVQDEIARLVREAQGR
jgi:cell pole-organizing protein PopZ